MTPCGRKSSRCSPTSQLLREFLERPAAPSSRCGLRRQRSHDAESSARPLHDRRPARRRRHGRGLSRARQQARARRGDQDPAVPLHRRSRTPRPLRARSADCSRHSIIRTSARSTGWKKRMASRALVLELVEGPTLADRLGARAAADRDALAIARQIAEALDAAHEKGIVHRDLKPANIVLQGAEARPAMCARRCSTSAWPRRWRGSRPARRSQGPPARSTARRDGRDARHARVHESRAGARAGRRQAHRHLGVRVCAVRDADGTARRSPAPPSPTRSRSILERDPDWTTLPADTPTPIRKCSNDACERTRRSACATSPTQSSSWRNVPPWRRLALQHRASSRSLPISRAHRLDRGRRSRSCVERADRALPSGCAAHSRGTRGVRNSAARELPLHGHLAGVCPLARRPSRRVRRLVSAAFRSCGSVRSRRSSCARCPGRKAHEARSGSRTARPSRSSRRDS